MGWARRFLNLIVPGGSPGVKLLRRIDLAASEKNAASRHHLLFYGDAYEKPAAAGGSSMAAAAMETIQFAGPSTTFRAINKEWKMNCFPLPGRYTECKLICADQSGRGFVFDRDLSKVSTLATLRNRKRWLTQTQPISVFVHKPFVDGKLDKYNKGSSLFVMEKVPQPEPPTRHGGGDGEDGGSVQQESEQFVGFIKQHTAHNTDNPWHCHLLPPPPFVQETIHWSNDNCPQITAYGVVGGGSHVCISVDGVGTYCLDTESLTWSQVGKWTLPFHGKVEYVRELNLWFGFSSAADDDGRRQHLAAADLSGMLLDSSSSSQPQWLVGGPWQELVGQPEEWKECKDPQFVSLGSGRFCIARFFSFTEAGSGDGEVVHKKFTILTGVEINSSGLELQITPHKSKRIDDTSIETLF